MVSVIRRHGITVMILRLPAWVILPAVLPVLSQARQHHRVHHRAPVGVVRPGAAAVEAAAVDGKKKFQPGFRLSEMDVGILLLGLCGSVLLARFDERLGMTVLFVLAHFFLFCNVLRMSRPLELIWAGLFVLLAGSTFHFGLPPWNTTLVGMLVVTVILAIIQFLLSSYHGVFWRKINPNLKQWWVARDGCEQ